MSNSTAPQILNSSKTFLLLGVKRDAAMLVWEMNPSYMRRGGGEETIPYSQVLPRQAKLGMKEPVYFETPFILLTKCIRTRHHESRSARARTRKPCFPAKRRRWEIKAAERLKAFSEHVSEFRNLLNVRLPITVLLRYELNAAVIPLFLI